MGEGPERADPERLRQAKAALRVHMREVRAALPAAERDRLARLAEERLVDLPEVRSASTVAAFLSFGTEIPTARLVAACVARGQRVVVPFVDQRELHMAPYRPGDPLVRSGLGVPEPAARVPIRPGQLDVVVVPGLAFDRDGFRLGYGGGHYDRFLLLLGPGATSIGLGFQGQLLAAVPHGPSDSPLDLIVTDGEVARRPPSRSSSPGGGS